MSLVDTVVCGHVLDVLSELPSDYVDCVVTSPPYWGLRSYGVESVATWGGDKGCEHIWGDRLGEKYQSHQDRLGNAIDPRTSSPAGGVKHGQEFHESLGCICSRCGSWRGQLGLEPHPGLYIQHLVEIFREVRRVLKPSGTLWLNMGDTFYGSGGAGGDYNVGGLREGQTRYKQNHKAKSNWLQPKQKLMLPARVAIALQDDGWILRNEICWAKPNPMPESVRDRLTETWESVYLFAKSRRYWFDLDAIRKTHYSENTLKRYKGLKPEPRKLQKSPSDRTDSNASLETGLSSKYPDWHVNPLGKNPGDVWRIPTRPFKGAHFAVFPPELVERCLEAGCPKWICRGCGKPRTRITKTDYEFLQKKHDMTKYKMISDQVGWGTKGPPANAIHQTLGWTDCGCGAGFRGGVVLDPFAGSGTALVAARKMALHYIGVEINPSYVEMARKRLAKFPARLDLLIREEAVG